jgi:hypothetical protein
MAWGTLARAARTNTADKAKRTGASPGCFSSSEIGSATAISTAARAIPIPLFTQNAVFRSVGVTSLRCTMASAKPDSTSTEMSTTNTDAKATVPKSAGSSILARTMKTALPIRRDDTDLKTVHVMPPTAVLRRSETAPSTCAPNGVASEPTAPFRCCGPADASTIPFRAPLTRRSCTLFHSVPS